MEDNDIPSSLQNAYDALKVLKGMVRLMEAKNTPLNLTEVYRLALDAETNILEEARNNGIRIQL